MFVLDTFLGWVFRTVATAADTEMNDDTALREQLLEAEMRREMGEISDDEFADIEVDVLQRIREIKERREGASGPIDLGSEPLDATGDSHFQVEATMSGDFYGSDRSAGADEVSRSESVNRSESPVGVSQSPRTNRTAPTKRPSRTIRTRSRSSRS